MKSIYLLITLLFGFGVRADVQDQGQKQSGLQKLSFEDFKEACRNPSLFHSQVAPANIQISCGNVELKWVPDTSSELPLATARYVTSTVSSDKYVVDSLTAPLNSPAQMMACPSFKEISEKVETVLAVTCEEIINYTGTTTNFCEDSLNSLKAANPGALIVQETGRVVNLCESEPADKDQDQDQDQDYPDQDQPQDQDQGQDLKDQDQGSYQPAQYPTPTKHKKCKNPLKRAVGKKCY